MLNVRLRPEEEAALNLRALYDAHGYSFYRMSRFEEYDFYAGKKDFLTSSNILTFTDINGKLMALRPDVTLSIIKHMKFIDDVPQKFYYDEKVYRVPKNANTFREISQAGIECAGNLNTRDLREVLELALLSLKTIASGRKFILDVANAAMIAELVPETQSRNEILKCIAEKNIHELKQLNADEKLVALMTSPKLDANTISIIDSLNEYHEHIRIDFSVLNNLNYYNGIVFRGFIEGIPESILSGGQYDNLMGLMGHKNCKAIGFAVYLDLVERGFSHD